MKSPLDVLDDISRRLADIEGHVLMMEKTHREQKARCREEAEALKKEIKELKFLLREVYKRNHQLVKTYGKQ